jgi:hypothetical protein
MQQDIQDNLTLKFTGKAGRSSAQSQMKDLVKKFEDAKTRIAKLKLYREAGSKRGSKRGSLGGSTENYNSRESAERGGDGAQITERDEEQYQEDGGDHSGILVGDHYDLKGGFIAEAILVPAESQFLSNQTHINKVENDSRNQAQQTGATNVHEGNEQSSSGMYD